MAQFTAITKKRNLKYVFSIIIDKKKNRAKALAVWPEGKLLVKATSTPSVRFNFMPLFNSLSQAKYFTGLETVEKTIRFNACTNIEGTIYSTIKKNV
jgi:hypothetical protein